MENTGVLQHPAVTAELARRFAPEKVFSPSALETYLACPFRFWLEHVIGLAPFDNPATRADSPPGGVAFRRALARFHNWVRDTVPQTLTGAELPEAMTEELARHIDRVVGEYAQQALSAASRGLWLLEGERLKRLAKRYRTQWHKFRQPWRSQKITPLPWQSDADFGTHGSDREPLVITVGDVEVRIGGCIDRIDLAELQGETGFWVIDYETGLATRHTEPQAEQFTQLRRALYALAVERVLLKDQATRPLGLAYWVLAGSGAKVMPAGKQALDWFSDREKWPKFREQLERWVAELVQHIRNGEFPLAPRSEHCTDRCPFGSVCRITESRNTGKVLPIALPVV
jgi:ATP-dependent helicase/DNAse subunit B